MNKNNLKLITPFIDNKNLNKELNFALIQNGAIYATDTRKAIKFNFEEIKGKSLIHKKLFKALEAIVHKDEILRFENDYLYTDNVKLKIDTAYYIEDEEGKHKIGARAEDYPDISEIIDIQLPYHFVIEDIKDLQWELTQKNCFIDDLHLDPVIVYNDCSIFDIYYKPQMINEKEQLESATVKIIAKKTDENGELNTQFIAVFMGREFESKAKEELHDGY
jgi:hypothetical protein